MIRMPSGRGTRISVVSAVILMWAALRWWLVPSLIRAAYREESWSVFNDALSGRAVHPVERYLDTWYSWSLTASIIGLVTAVAVYLPWRFPVQRKRAIRLIVGGEAPIRARTLLWYSMMIGTAGGLGEALYRGARQIVTDRPAAEFYIELLWMAPLSSACVSLLIGIVLVALARLGDTEWDLGKATLVLGSLALYGIIQSEGIPLASSAEVILAIGFATVLARFGSNRVGALERGIQRARPYLVTLVIGLGAFGWRSLPAAVEERVRSGRPAPTEDRPNILLIILDTVRAANLSLYGYERQTTPEIDDWAASGAVFEHAQATAPWTLPTHATAFTGLYNFELGTGFWRPLDERFRTLAEVLTEQGYATGAFTANPHYTTNMSGLDQGFDRFEDHMIGPRLFFGSSWLAGVTVRRLFPYHGGYALKDASQVTDQFLNWVDTMDGRPFFAFLNYFDAHEPYISPERFSDFGPEPEESWPDFRGSWQSDESHSYTPKDAQLWINRYDNAIRYIDDNLGTIRDALEAEGLLDETILVITSDHGELWGEHGQIGHAQSLYLPSLRVPLILSYPGHVPRRRIAEGVSLRDLPASLLDLADVEDGAFPGHSLIPLVDASGQSHRRSPLLAELDHDVTNDNPWDPVSRGDMKSLIEGDFYYILNGDGVEELYDLSVDPHELNDLSGDPEAKEILLGLRTRLDSIVGERDPDG